MRRPKRFCAAGLAAIAALSDSEEVYRWEAKRLVLVRLVSQTNVDFKDAQVRYVRATRYICGEKPSVTIEPIFHSNEVI